MAAKALKLTVTVTKGPCAGPTQTFQSHVVTVGRGPENMLVLAQDPKVSRNQLELHVSATGTFIRNLSQKNPIAVNGEIVHEKLVSGQLTLHVGESEILIDRPDLPRENQLKVVPGGAGALQKTQTGSVQPQHAFGSSVQAHQPAGAPAMPPPSGFTNPGFDANGGFHTVPTPPPGSPVGELLKNPKARFYIILVVVGLVGVLLFSGNEKKKKNDLKLRDSVQSNEDYVKSENEVKRMRDDPKFKAKDSIQYQMAEQHYTRGFRDYRNGQYGRAIEGFQAALSFYPSHELARRYYSLAQRKFDQMAQHHMVEGRRYYGKANYQRCMAEFRHVIIMKKDPRDAIRREAKQLYDECQTRLEEGR